MGLSRHGLGRRFLHQTRMPTAHEGLVVEIKLEETEGFLADGLAFLQIRSDPAVEVFDHGTAAVRVGQNGKQGLFDFLIPVANGVFQGG